MENGDCKKRMENGKWKMEFGKGNENKNEDWKEENGNLKKRMENKKMENEKW